MNKRDAFCKALEAAIPKLRKQILVAFRKKQTRAGFRVIWAQFEEIVNPILIGFLTKRPLLIPRSDIKQATSKSTYPDLKVTYRGKHYAVDVKSGENTRDPWYDIGRLDTYVRKHLQKYAAEFSIVVRWAGRRPSKVLNVYIEERGTRAI